MRKIRIRELIKPKKVEVHGLTEDSRYGKFVAEPLERGFGLTLGNALRRILLSSLEGAAITSVRIDGVMHEFSTISGVVEDVSQIILNLKDVVPYMEEKDTATLNVTASGPCEITASMLTGDADVSILNPDLVICTLSEGGKLDMEVTVKIGRGYVQAQKNAVEGVPVGTIFIDSIFSPIRKVNHFITNARVGQTTDYDKLTMEIWTDGTLDARHAIAESSRILQDQLEVFVGEGLVVEAEEPVEEEVGNDFNEHLFRKIDEIELSVRSANCLENADIKFLGELCCKTEQEMLRTKNFGRKSLNEIKEILTERNLELGMRFENFPSREELEKINREQMLKQNQ